MHSPHIILVFLSVAASLASAFVQGSSYNHGEAGRPLNLKEQSGRRSEESLHSTLHSHIANHDHGMSNGERPITEASNGENASTQTRMLHQKGLELFKRQNTSATSPTASSPGVIVSVTVTTTGGTTTLTTADVPTFTNLPESTATPSETSQTAPTSSVAITPSTMTTTASTEIGTTSTAATASTMTTTASNEIGTTSTAATTSTTPPSVVVPVTSTTANSQGSTTVVSTSSTEQATLSTNVPVTTTNTQGSTTTTSSSVPAVVVSGTNSQGRTTTTTSALGRGGSTNTRSFFVTTKDQFGNTVVLPDATSGAVITATDRAGRVVTTTYYPGAETTYVKTSTLANGGVTLITQTAFVASNAVSGGGGGVDSQATSTQPSPGLQTGNVGATSRKWGAEIVGLAVGVAGVAWAL